jgi:hypothetical protein
MVSSVSARWILPLLLVTSPPLTALAQSDVVKDRETYRAGLALEAAGDWAGALVKFRQVAERRPTPQVRFHIARCQEHLGRWTEALGTYRLALGEAEALKIEEVQREANAARLALEERVPRLTLARGAGTETAVILVDGVELGASVLASPLVLDPGPHLVEARAPRQERLVPLLSREITLQEGERRTLLLEVPAAASPSSPTPPPSPPPSPLPPRSRTPAWIALGAGAALGVTAAAFWVRRQDTLDELASRCVGGRCPPSLEPVAQRGQQATWISAGAGLGAVALLGTGTWLLLRPSPREESAPAVLLGASPAGPSFALRGAF